jgi:hypothetical protein
VTSLAEALATRLERRAELEGANAYPLTKYQLDPVAYAKERLHVAVLMPHQKEILRGIAAGIAGNGPDRAAVRSGQKCAKTHTAILATIWFYECFEGARVFLCAAIEAQTKNVLWRELGQVLRQAKKGGSDIDGALAKSPAGGFISSDGSREIKGITGRDIEAIAGLSGRQLTVIDEASHLPETKAQVFAGNTMGGGSLLFISNPTKNDGPFHAAFHAQKEHWQTFHVDAEEVAAWQERTGIRIPFTVTRAKIEEAREMYGEDSPFWALRVKGEFLRNETGRAIPMFRIEEAQARWAEMPDNDGPLVIGYDPAGPGDQGDEHAWAIRRGRKILALHCRRGIGESAAVDETLSLMKIHRRDHETPHINIDSQGQFGPAIFRTPCTSPVLDGPRDIAHPVGRGRPVSAKRSAAPRAAEAAP